MQEEDKNQNDTLLFLMSDGCLQEKKLFVGIKLENTDMHH